MQILSIILLNGLHHLLFSGFGDIILGPAQPLQEADFTVPKFSQSQFLEIEENQEHP